jgi:tRNA threonylcarbamoyladenosine biosynthesis protein TsaB
MNLLALDTTSRYGSVALLTEGELRGEIRLVEAGAHSVTLFPAIETLLRLAGVGPAAVDAYAVVVGPGSFTGVRIGISTVQGLALASGRPVLGVNTLEALAARMHGAAPALVPMVDAHRDQVYVAVYDGERREHGAPMAVVPETWIAEAPAGAAFLGDGALKHRETIRAQRPDAVFPDKSLFLAATVGRLALPRLLRGEGGEASTLRPLYLRAPDIRPSPQAAAPPR